MLDKGLTLKPELTAARLRELLDYDPGTGVFRHKHGKRAGKIAGSIRPPKNYRYLIVDGHHYSAHRAAWLYVTGEWPADQIDHRDGLPDSNAFRNLRECTNAENCQNRAKRSDNESGFVGVTWDRRNKRWRSQIKLEGRNHFLGFFDDPALGGAAYLEAKKTRHAFQPVPRPS